MQPGRFGVRLNSGHDFADGKLEPLMLSAEPASDPLSPSLSLCLTPALFLKTKNFLKSILLIRHRRSDYERHKKRSFKNVGRFRNQVLSLPGVAPDDA